jgi:hypothetical protein
MDPEVPDYAAILQQSMAAALAQVDALKEEVSRLREQAIDELAAARDEQRRIEREAEKLAEAAYEKHYGQLKETLRKDLETGLQREAITRMLRAGRSRAEIAEWLGLPTPQIAAVQRELGMQPLGSGDAWVEIESSGRTGTVTFRRGETKLDFDFELGGGGGVAAIFVPHETQWEAQTGLALAERPGILDFIGAETVRLQAPSCTWRVGNDAVLIVRM